MQTKLRVGGAIVSAAISAVSFAFNASNFKPDISWALIAFISFIVFVVLMFWLLVDCQSQIKALQKKLDNPILQNEQEGHILNIKELLQKWSVSLSVPTISQVLPGTSSNVDWIKTDPRYDYLKGHLPFNNLWQYVSDWDSKMQEYLVKCKKLRSEIEVSWKVNGTTRTGAFAFPILENLEGEKLNFRMSYGRGHKLEEMQHQELIANNIPVVYGNEYSNNPTYGDMTKDELCRQQILCIEYLKVKDNFLGNSLTIEVKQLYSDLIKLGHVIVTSLLLYLERADYAINHCSTCPIEQRVSRKEGS